MGSFFGVYIPAGEGVATADSPLKQVYFDKTEVLTLLKKFKTARFKQFKTEEEAKNFSSSDQTDQPPAEQTLSSPRPSDACTFRSLKPQDEVKFRKAIEATPSDLIFLTSCVETNPRYLVTPCDTPTILHQGSRHNALHVAARHGKTDAARLVLELLVSGRLLSTMYPGEGVEQARRRNFRLTDLYLNMPDKGGGDTPLHLAVKFGHLEMARLLCSLPLTKVEQVNRNGEVVEQVVGSRVDLSPGVVKQIRKIISGKQMVIPVFKEGGCGAQIIGKPVSVKEATEMMVDTSGESSFLSLSSAGTSSPARSAMDSPVWANSSMSSSPGKRGSPLRVLSPVRDRGDCRDRADLSLSAVMGPVEPGQASKLFQSWRREGQQERLLDPCAGVERQGRLLARREGVSWQEWWPWLAGGVYTDLASREGLGLLEDHLEQAVRDAEQRRRMKEVEDLDCSLFGDQLQRDDLGNKEVEITGQPCDTPVKGGSDVADSALSPLSRLALELDNLNLVKDRQGGKLVGKAHQARVGGSEWQGRERESESQVQAALNQFTGLVVPLLADSLPEAECGEGELAEWGQVFAGHWSGLRRQVNNWRSDPGGRYDGLDFVGLGAGLVRGMVDQLELELGAHDVQRVGLLLDRLAGLKVEKETGAKGREELKRDMFSSSREQGVKNMFNSTRELVRGDSVPDYSGVLEVQGLARLLALQCRTGGLGGETASSLLSRMWDVERVRPVLATSRVNMARRFLHRSSSRSSEGEVTEENFKEETEEVEWVHETREVEEDEDDEVGFLTPPTSPGSMASSMETCSEGLAVYLAGDNPSQADRRVAEALCHMEGVELEKFPRVRWYLLHLASFTGAQRKCWPGEVEEGPVRTLDFNMTY